MTADRLTLMQTAPTADEPGPRWTPSEHWRADLAALFALIRDVIEDDARRRRAA